MQDLNRTNSVVGCTDLFGFCFKNIFLLIMNEVMNQQWLEENGFTHEKLVELCDKRLQWLKELSDEMSDIDKLSRFILDDDIWQFLLTSPHKLVIDVDMYNEFMNEVQNVPMIEIREALQKYKINKK